MLYLPKVSNGDRNLFKEKFNLRKMKERKFQSPRRYLISFIVATVVFILIILLSSTFSYFEFARVSFIQNSFAYDIFLDKLDYTLFEKNVCSTESFEQISKDLNFQGRIIDDLEKKLGKNNDGVLFRKRFYTLIELEHFESIRVMNDFCDSKISNILFFYSNKEGELTKSEDAGKLLDRVAEKNPNSLMIYSFDINLDSPLINKLKIKYGISTAPSVLVNENVLIENPSNIDEIESALEKDKTAPKQNSSVIYLN